MNCDVDDSRPFPNLYLLSHSPLDPTGYVNQPKATAAVLSQKGALTLLEVLLNLSAVSSQIRLVKFSQP